MCRSRAGDLKNKAPPTRSLPLVQRHAVASYLSAGRGGGGEKRSAGARRAAPLVLAGRGGEEDKRISATPLPLLRAGWRCPWRREAPPTPRSCCRGGSRALGAGGSPLRRPVRAAISELPKRRRRTPPLSMAFDAILCSGVKIIRRSSSSTTPSRQDRATVLAWKQLEDLSPGSIFNTAPSGKFPGGGVVSRAARSLSGGGEDLGLDCFFTFSPRVLFVKIVALSYASHKGRGLDENCIPPTDQ